MNTDIRISTSFLNHRKRKKLKQILGPGSTDYLIDLWISTAVNRPKGILYDMDKADIALDAGWDGNAGQFVDSLLEVGFLDWDGEWYKLHDWEKHQSWAVNSETRSVKAAKNQLLRWCLENIKNKEERSKFVEWYNGKHEFVKGSNTETILSAYESYTNRNTPILSPPIPSPPNTISIVGTPNDDQPAEPPKPKHIFESNSEEYRLAKLLFDRILVNNPNHKKPDLQKWAVHIGKMIRLDNRTPQAIANIIAFAQTDEFEKVQVLSTEKLRAQFDRLYLKQKSRVEKEIGKKAQEDPVVLVCGTCEHIKGECDYKAPGQTGCAKHTRIKK